MKKKRLSICTELKINITKLITKSKTRKIVLKMYYEINTKYFYSNPFVYQIGIY